MVHMYTVTNTTIFLVVRLLLLRYKLNGTYVYRHKHNYIPCNTFTITKVQTKWYICIPSQTQLRVYSL